MHLFIQPAGCEDSHGFCAFNAVRARSVKPALGKLHISGSQPWTLCFESTTDGKFFEAGEMLISSFEMSGVLQSLRNGLACGTIDARLGGVSLQSAMRALHTPGGT